MTSPESPRLAQPAPREPRAVTLRENPRARVRLFCFPYAGAGASLFLSWAPALPAWIQVCPVQFPGRETRLAEPPAATLPALIGEIADALEPYQDKPLAFFGHSMGGAVAFETARELRRRGLRGPDRLFVSACRAPHRPSPLPPLATLTGEAFLAGVEGRYGPFPEEIRRYPDALDLLLPILRADLSLVETYCCAEEPPLDCPISAFGGTADPALHMDELREWRRHTAKTFDLRAIEGGHFFVRQPRGALLRAVEERLESSLI